MQRGCNFILRTSVALSLGRWHLIGLCCYSVLSLLLRSVLLHSDLFLIV